MKPRWKSFEEQVRDIASHLYARPCEPDRIAGNDIDGVVSIDDTTKNLIEITVNCTLEKVRTDIAKLIIARSALFQNGILSRRIIVLDKEPTQAMLNGGRDNNIAVVSVSQLAAEFFHYERYRFARLKYPFGSAVHPETGAIDETNYVPVLYEDQKSNKKYTPQQIADGLSGGRNFVVLGEYGSGKSRCVAEVFGALSKVWADTFRFPIAVNLRECWGLERGDEVVRRHFDRLGLDDLSGSAVRAYNRKSLIFLLDGFDEIGSQSWSVDDARLRKLRAQALVSAKDINVNSGTGTLITGRAHYFSSDKEMMISLGFTEQNTTVLYVKEEFTLPEMLSYFKAADIDVTLPEWLPRRPLICHTIAQLNDDERNEMFGVGNNEAAFWNYFIQVLCKRDARINTLFDPDTVYEVFVTLAGETRTKPGDVGPINQRELQEAFEGVVGKLPVEEASVMLQRLPSLGRVGPESSDRQFIDGYILDGLRAHHIHRLVTGDQDNKRRVASYAWINPLQSLGQKVLAAKALSSIGGYIGLAKLATNSKNRTLAADIVLGLGRMGEACPEFDSIVITDASISTIDVEDGYCRNVIIQSSTIEEVNFPSSPPHRL